MSGPPERRDSDTAASYRALCDYCAMGSGGKRRSIRDLHEHYTAQSASEALAMRPPTLSLATLFGWSKKYEWERRAEEWDAAIVQAEEHDRAAIRRARRLQLENQDWQAGSDLRDRVAELLAEMPRFLRRSETQIEQNGELVRVITLALSAGPGELARAMKVASELQRLSVGEPTEIHKQVESEIGAFLDVLRDNLSPEEYARIVDLAARKGAASE